MVKIENKFKILDITQPHEYFYKLFKNNINELRKLYQNSSSHTWMMLENGEVDWMDTILQHFSIFNYQYFQKNINFEQFHKFISFFEKELWDLGQCIYDIDVCKYYLKERVPTIQNNKILANIMLHKFYCLISEHIIIKLSALFDLNDWNPKLKRKENLDLKYNFKAYKNSFKQIKNKSIKQNLKILQKFINGLSKKVNIWRDNIFNTYKHNFSDDSLDKLENQQIELQELFNIWYIMYAFVLPLLKLLFSYRRDGKKDFNVFYTPIEFESYIDVIYKKISEFKNS